MLSVVMHSPLCHRQMSQKWRGTDQMEGTTSRWKVERSVVHHHRGVCGEVVQEPLQQEPIKRLLGWRGGLLTSPGGRVLAGEVRQQKGEVS